MQHKTHHPIRDKDFWQSRLQRLYRIMQTMSEQETQDLRVRADLERQAGLVHRYLGQNGDANLLSACEYGAALALMRTLQRRSDAFRVEIRQEAQTLVLSGDRMLDFGWPNWLDAWALALLLDHDDALSILSTPDCIDACSLPPENVDRFWPFLCSAYVTIAAKEPIAKDIVKDCEIIMQLETLMPSEMVVGCYKPLLGVMRAILDNNQRSFTISVKQALSAFHGYYAELQDGDAEVAGLYHLPLSALVALGTGAGLRLNVESEALLPPGKVDSTNRICAIYPPLAIFDALEATWFMEWEGFEKHDKSNIYQKDEKLVASYFSTSAPGIPYAVIDFELLQEGESPDSVGHGQPPLDVGQLLSIAQSLASNPVTTGSGEKIYLLEEAVTAVDLALKYIALTGGVFDPETLHSHAGRSLYEAEPGRFDPERLLVYRNALADQAGIEQLPADASLPAVGDQAGARGQVFAIIEELKPFLLPILQAIATDTSGEVVRSLEPLPDDYEKVFDRELAGVAKKHYAEWWKHQDLHVGSDEKTRIDAHMAPAGMLVEENELSYHFPRGYRSIAAHLNPHRIWTSWKYYQEGESTGLSMNGLVWVDDHWAWFPKPWKLTEYLEPDGTVSRTRH